MLFRSHSAVRSQFVYDVKDNIGRLYDLPQDPTAIARRVDYLLERDRFMCSPRGYQVCALSREPGHN